MKFEEIVRLRKSMSFSLLQHLLSIFELTFHVSIVRHRDNSALKSILNVFIENSQMLNFDLFDADEEDHQTTSLICHMKEKIIFHIFGFLDTVSTPY
jgi:hypothetical protein